MSEILPGEMLGGCYTIIYYRRSDCHLESESAVYYVCCVYKRQRKMSEFYRQERIFEFSPKEVKSNFATGTCLAYV